MGDDTPRKKSVADMLSKFGGGKAGGSPAPAPKAAAASSSPSWATKKAQTAPAAPAASAGGSGSELAELKAQLAAANAEIAKLKATPSTAASSGGTGGCGLPALGPLGATLEALLARLETAEAAAGISPPAGGGGGGGSSGGGGGGGAAKFDAAMAKPLAALAAASTKAGGAIEGLGAIVAEGFSAMGAFLAAAATSAKPSDAEFTTMLAPIRDSMRKAADAKGDRKVPKDEGATVAEAMNALGWLQAEMMGTKPGAFIQDNAIEAHMFWANKVRTANKGKDNGLCDFVDTVNAVLEALKGYVVANHTTGVAWGKAA